MRERETRDYTSRYKPRHVGGLWGWKKQGNQFSRGPPERMQSCQARFGLSCQTWEEGFLLKLKALGLMSPSWDTLTSSPGALLLSKAPSRNWIEALSLWDPCDPSPSSLFSLKGSCQLFSSFGGLFSPFAALKTKCANHERATWAFPLPHLCILKRRTCDIN